jgi:hypothetical protein
MRQNPFVLKTMGLKFLSSPFSAKALSLFLIKKPFFGPQKNILTFAHISS